VTSRTQWAGRRADACYVLAKWIALPALLLGTALAFAACASAPPPEAAAPVAPASEPAPLQRHTVKPGETLSQLSRRYGVSVEAIARHNGIADPSRIPAVVVLEIPRAEAREEEPTSAPSPSVSAAPPAAPPPKPAFDFEAVDRELERGEGQLRRAHFEEALATATRALGLLEPMADAPAAQSFVVRGEILAATTLLALHGESDAVPHLARALEVQPDLVLGSSHSPKLRAVLEQVRRDRD
jgi:hypothetical protein